VQPPPAAGGRFSKDAFTVDLDSAAVTCPAGQTGPLRLMNNQRPGSVASFGQAGATCPLATRCTNSKTGRTVFVGPYEEQLTRARAKQHDLDFQHDYRATRPKVERKIAHLTRRRGQVNLAADFAPLAAVVNLARLAILGASHTSSGWVQPTNGQ
jgi:Transposase DDE domain